MIGRVQMPERCEIIGMDHRNVFDHRHLIVDRLRDRDLKKTNEPCQVLRIGRGKSTCNLIKGVIVCFFLLF